MVLGAEGPLGPSAARLHVVAASAAPALVATAVLALGLAHGGYAPTAWGWTALPLLWLAVLLLALREGVALTRGGFVLAAAVVALVGWTAASAWWSLSVPRTMFEVERDLVYAGSIVSVLLLPAAAVRRTVVGIVAGLVALTTYAVAVYLVSPPAFDTTQGYLLFRPVGYANAVGALVVLALPPVLACVSDGRASVRAAAGAATVILAVVLALTHNRSGVLALACALVLWLWWTRDSRALVVAAPALAVTGIVAALAPDQIAARRFAALVVAGGAAAGAAVAVRAPRPRFDATRVIPVAAVVVAAGLAVSTRRLGDRAHYWRAAWHGFVAHPLAGGGAGTFDVQWFRYRDIARTVHDAHNLYLGTLAELGIVGVLLLLALLVTPIVCALRERDPLTASLLASYCGFLVHAAFEWDWKFPLVTGCGLAFGAALVALHGRPIRLPARTRAVGALATALAALFALATLGGNSRIASAEAHMATGDTAAAAAEASSARTVVPWSSEPWLVLADATGRGVALRTAAARDPNDWTVWVRLAEVAHGRERLDAARRALELNPLLERD